MAKKIADFGKVKAGFWSGIGIAVAAIVVGFGWAWLRPRIGSNLPNGS